MNWMMLKFFKECNRTENLSRNRNFVHKVRNATGRYGTGGFGGVVNHGALNHGALNWEPHGLSLREKINHLTLKLYSVYLNDSSYT